MTRKKNKKKTQTGHLRSTSVPCMWLWLIGPHAGTQASAVYDREFIKANRWFGTNRIKEHNPLLNLKVLHTSMQVGALFLLTLIDFNRARLSLSSLRTTRNWPSHSSPSYVKHKPISTFSQRKPRGAETSERQKKPQRKQRKERPGPALDNFLDSCRIRCKVEPEFLNRRAGNFHILR